ncbi:glycoside hydrolase family 38 C-terminal domain-containing protein [Enterococcus termitis]
MSGSVSKIHRSIYSSRYDLKKMNDTIENRLIFQLEPLMLMADDLGVPFKRELLDYIWKLLLKNHAHDSIGGCNTDKTNEMILARYKEADQLSYSTVDYLVRKISESIEGIQENDLVLFNTMPYSRTESYTVEVSTKKEYIQLFDQNQNELNVQILSTEKVYAGEVRRSQSDYDESKYYYIHKMMIEKELEPLSYAIVTVQESDEMIQKEQKENQRTSIENEALKIIFSEGKLSITDKIQEATYENCLYVEESGDEGDTYDYSPAYDDYILQLGFDAAKAVISTGELISTLTLTGDWQVPHDLESRKEQRLDQKINYTIRLMLKKDEKRINMKVTINNQAKDHRMRVVIKTPVQSVSSYADTLFGIVERKNQDPHIQDWRTLGWKEEPTEIYPMIHYANIHDELASWTVMSKGIKEYQIIDQAMHITLFRGVGFLGRPELLRRPGDASGNQYRYIPTPDSQLLGELEMELSLMIETSFDPAKIQKDYQKYSVSVPYYQIQTLNRFTNPIQYFQSNKVDHLNPLQTFSDWSNPNLVFSALELSRDEKWINIRMYNPSLTETIDAQTVVLPASKTVRLIDLNEQVLETYGAVKTVTLGTFKPGEIKTISIER